MALISCPECNKEISDKATFCIHCGFPLSGSNNGNSMNQKDTCIIKGIEYDLTSFKERVLKGEEEHKELCNSLASYIGSVAIATDIVWDIKRTGRVPKEWIPYSKRHPQPTIPGVRCPRCGGTQITTSARGVNGFWGFIGASKTVNRCANCGKTWEPKR